MTGLAKELRKDSPAFRKALLESERLRIQIVIVAIAVAFGIRSLRTAIAFNHENLYFWIITGLFIAILVAYELLMLRAMNWSIQSGLDLPDLAWIANIVVESCMPALAIVLLSSGSIEVVYKPLANPAVQLYFLFIVLSTLRLDPLASRLSGIVAAVSYLMVAAYLGWKPTLGGGTSLLSPERAVIGFSLSFVVGGFVAGAVASEIRKQVEAGLREAELKRQAQRQVERLERDMEVARSIQQSLLPTSTPHIEGFEIAGWNQPADQTGGDYYDWQVFPDGKLFVALADVVGHGIGAALLAAACRAYARANFTAERGLLTAMEQVNSSLSRDIGEGRFVTFVAAICSPAHSRVELLSAGHGPLFLYRLQEDLFEKFTSQGLPLGLIPDFMSEPPLVLDLNPGDILVLTTDGFFEWANAKEELFGVKRLEDSIRTSRERPPAEIISSLYKAVIEFSDGTKQNDDLTALIIKRK